MPDRLVVDLTGDGQVVVSSWPDGGVPTEVSRARLLWPLDGDALEDLRWYLEDYLLAPFGVWEDRGPVVRGKLAGWGHEVFGSVFGRALPPQPHRQADSGGAEPQGRPRLVDGDLPDRLHAPGGQQRREDVPVQVGAELARLRVSDPGKPVLPGRLDSGRGDGVKLRLVPGERDNDVGRAGLGRRIGLRRSDRGHVAGPRELGDPLAGLDLKLGGHVHAAIMVR